jgi:hypothetical protein
MCYTAFSAARAISVYSANQVCVGLGEPSITFQDPYPDLCNFAPRWHKMTRKAEQLSTILRWMVIGGNQQQDLQRGLHLTAFQEKTTGVTVVS